MKVNQLGAEQEHDLLSPLSINNYTVRDTFTFANFIKNFSPNISTHMVSFDVVSLFSNIPLNETIDIICDKIYREKLIQINIPEKDLSKLLKICTTEAHFLFNGKIFEQGDGVAMGSPLGPVLANIFMAYLEEEYIRNYDNSALILWQ